MNAQQHAGALYKAHETFKEESLKHRRFKHADVKQLIDKIDSDGILDVVEAGKSVEGKSIHHLTYGKGNTVLLLWSQMHGDEPTATMALFDIFNFLSGSGDEFDDFRKEIKDKLTLHFIPMLNPDGADRYQRRNAMNVDLNRDAQKLEFPESRVLKKVRDATNADFGFNLHDQSKYYNVDKTANTAAISFLAPAYNYEKEINSTREKAMQLIVVMNEVVQQILPGHVGRYNDDFEPRAFGDNIQKWGTSTILVEAGGIRGDEEKQFNRRIHFTMLLSAFKALADGSYENQEVNAYESIPKNDRKMADLIIRNLNVKSPDGIKTIDVAIFREEVQNEDATAFYHKSKIADLGDLSTFFGYQEFEASAFNYRKAKVYKENLAKIADLKSLDMNSLLNQGISEFICPSMKDSFEINSLPVNVHKSAEEVDIALKPDSNPSFFLERDGVLEYGIINGFMIQLNKE